MVEIPEQFLNKLILTFLVFLMKRVILTIPHYL